MKQLACKRRSSAFEAEMSSSSSFSSPSALDVVIVGVIIVVIVLARLRCNEKGVGTVGRKDVTQLQSVHLVRSVAQALPRQRCRLESVNLAARDLSAAVSIAKCPAYVCSHKLRMFFFFSAQFRNLRHFVENTVSSCTFMAVRVLYS